ncbi:hypothetical protein VNO80_15977 [Phaseolus coccineus]|uniref:Uncharacterized protein n=1 Tax=Phaseolus coccineus TaxID=3886 RepID=A0AAN9R2A3_PHACN
MAPEMYWPRTGVVAFDSSIAKIPRPDEAKIPARRIVVSIPNGPSALAVKEAAWGLARYAAISQIDKVLEPESQE